MATARISKPKRNSSSTKKLNSKDNKQVPEEQDNTRKYVAIIAAIIILLIFAGAIVYGLRPQAPSPQASLSTFEHNFDTANAIGVYSTYSTNASFAPVVGCSTAIVEAIAGRSPIHKSYNQIHYFVINQTSCTSAVLGPNATTNVTSINNCLAFSKSHPSIFVNYSTFTKTVINPDSLYFYGNNTSLLECGIATEFS